MQHSATCQSCHCDTKNTCTFSPRNTFCIPLLSYNICMCYIVTKLKFKTWVNIQTASLGLYTAASMQSSTLLIRWISEIPQKPLWPFGGELVYWGRVEVNWMVCSERLWVEFLWGYGHSPLGKWSGLAVYLGVILPLPLNCSPSTW